MMNGEHMAMGGYGYSLGSLLTGLLALLIKFFMLILVVALVAGLVIWIKNNFFKDNKQQIINYINADPILKIVTVIGISVIGIVVILMLVNSFMQPLTGYNMNMHTNMGMGYTTAFSFSSIFILLINILSIVLIISLIFALIAYVKRYIDGNMNFSKINNTAIDEEQKPQDNNYGENNQQIE
ncbi:hypothetical protein RDV78_01990 [Bacillota bacterium LX-D]|nr:hypothetical protein [Bacillota bacterium LX-D]